MDNVSNQSRAGWIFDEPIPAVLSLGCLQRIADATEKMAGNYTQLQSDRDWFKSRNEELRKSNSRMARRIAALQGVITKLKKKQA